MSRTFPCLRERFANVDSLCTLTINLEFWNWIRGDERSLSLSAFSTTPACWLPRPLFKGSISVVITRHSHTLALLSPVVHKYGHHILMLCVLLFFFISLCCVFSCYLVSCISVRGSVSEHRDLVYFSWPAEVLKWHAPAQVLRDDAVPCVHVSRWCRSLRDDAIPCAHGSSRWCRSLCSRIRDV